MVRIGAYVSKRGVHPYASVNLGSKGTAKPISKNTPTEALMLLIGFGLAIAASIALVMWLF